MKISSSPVTGARTLLNSRALVSGNKSG